jgi:ribosomal protein S18 acetylase RimI-like enzyme
MSAGFLGTINIRDATEDDLEACERLDLTYDTDYVWQVDVRDEAGAIATSFRTARLPRVMHVTYPRERSALASAIDSRKSDAGDRGHFNVLIAETSGEVRGYLVVRIDLGHSLVWVTDLAVGRAWRRQRIGSTLLLAAYGRAQQYGLRRLMVETQTKNYPGICFCQKNGLIFCGFNDRYYPNHDIALFFGQNVRA